MKNTMKRIAAIALALVMMFAVTACGSSAADELKYSQEIVTRMNTLTDTANTFSADIQVFFNDITEENRKTIMTDLDNMEAAYKAITEMKAPAAYAEFQELLNESAENAFKGIEVYRTELGTVTEDALDEAFVDRLAEGDEYMQAAAQKLYDASALMSEEE